MLTIFLNLNPSLGAVGHQNQSSLAGCVLRSPEGPRGCSVLHVCPKLQPTVCSEGDVVITEGRHYWEVEVSPKGSWRIGVVSKTAPRNLKSTMTPISGYWTLWRGASLWACTERPTKLRRAAPPPSDRGVCGL